MNCVPTRVISVCELRSRWMYALYSYTIYAWIRPTFIASRVCVCVFLFYLNTRSARGCVCVAFYSLDSLVCVGMAQASLLVSAGIPTNPCQLAGWAERIRDRVCAISKAVYSLELEKQTLVSMLNEAGMSDFACTDTSMCVDDRFSVGMSFRVTPSAKNACFSQQTAQSIVDLLSEEDTSVCSSTPTAICPPTPLYASPPTPTLVSPPPPIHTGKIDELEGIDPRDLTFEGFSCASASTRVLRVSEFSHINWVKVPTSDLKEWAKFFGMKPAQSRNVLVSEFTRFFNYLAAPSAAESTHEYTHKHDNTHTELFISAIKQKESLYERILLYETVEITEVYEYLKKIVPNTSMKLVKDFFASQQLHCGNTTTNLKRKQPREINEPPKKTRRELRRSITCP